MPKRILEQVLAFASCAHSMTRDIGANALNGTFIIQLPDKEGFQWHRDSLQKCGDFGKRVMY